MSEMQLVGMMCDCRLCGELKDTNELTWCVMNNKELCVGMRIHYGTKIPSVCDACREKYNLPIYERSKKVSISILRTTKAVLIELKKRFKLSYEGMIYKLISEAGYDQIYSELYAKKYELEPELLKKAIQESNLDEPD